MFVYTRDFTMCIYLDITVLYVVVLSPIVTMQHDNLGQHVDEGNLIMNTCSLLFLIVIS